MKRIGVIGSIGSVMIGLILMLKGFLYGPARLFKVGVCLLIISGLFWIFYYTFKNYSKNSKIVFYNRCRECDITDLSSDINKEKAKTIAHAYYISYGNDIEKFFNEGRELSEKLDKEKIQYQQAAKLTAIREAENKKLEAIRKVESDKYILLTKYSFERGRNKRVAMLTDIQKEYEDTAKSLESAVGTALAGEKETDWATHGGIASAIAGGAAGVAVASDIQAKNAQIRARNEANRQAMMPAVIAVSDSIMEYRKKATNLQKEIEAAKVKLVATTPAEEVLTYLDINTKKVEISETGAFTVSATIKLSEKMNYGFYIFEKVPAVVDGIISADLYQEGVKVGSALLVLPMMGIGSTTTIEGICLSGAKQNVPYEVKYTPYKLWAMEK